MAILASHNSYSYLKPAELWMYLALPFSRCQTLSIIEQYEAGVRLFDLRLAPDEVHGGIRVAHGLVKFRVSPNELNETLKFLNWKGQHEHAKIYVRVLMEPRKPNTIQEQAFAACCRIIMRRFSNIRFYGGHGAHKENWRICYFSFIRPNPSVIEDYSSVKCKGIRKILPRLYARKHNAEIRAEYEASEAFLMIDHIEL